MPVYYTRDEMVQFMNRQGIVCDYDYDYDNYCDQWFEYIDDDKYLKID